MLYFLNNPVNIVPYKKGIVKKQCRYHYIWKKALTILEENIRYFYWKRCITYTEMKDKAK